MNVMVTFLLGLLIGGMVGMGLTAIFTAAKRADEAAEAVVLPHPCDGPLYKKLDHPRLDEQGTRKERA